MPPPVDELTTADAPTRLSSELELATVVIPAKNEERSIARCLESVLCQDHANLQVIVVDGRSEDQTRDIVKMYARRDPRIELVECPQASIPKSLNLALAAARGRWFVRVDAHSTIPAGYLRRAVEQLETGRWGGVGGRKTGVGQTAAGNAIAAAMGSRFGVGGSVYHHGTAERTVNHIPFGCYPTELVRRVGGWDERLAANEDFEFDHRLRKLGHQLLFDPSMEIDWRCQQSILGLFRQYRRYGRAKPPVLKLHPDSLTPSHLAAPALVASLALVLIVGIRRPRLAQAILLPYGFALAAASVVTARRVGSAAARFRVPAAFIAMHLGWGLGFWEGMVALLRDRPSSPSIPGRPAG
jgi:succinoglycan biosynthesis protein ExoA